MGQQMDKASRLATVASEGHVIQVKKLSLSGTGNMNIRDDNGKTALMLAVEHSHVVATKTLIEAGADVNAKELSHTSGRTVLMMAVEIGAVDCVTTLLAAGAKTDGLDSNGNTCLTLAVKNRHLSCLQALIKAGADLNRCGSLGKTPLILAIESGDLQSAEMLLQAGANPNIGDIVNQTCLMIVASEETEQNQKCLQVLLRARPKLDIGDPNGRTALMTCVTRDNMTGLKMLLEGGADPNVKDSLGRTALMLAVLPGTATLERKIEMVNTLVKSGADVNLRDYHGKTVLMHAVESHPHLTDTKLYRIPGIDPNVVDRNGSTVLSLSVEKISDMPTFQQFLNYLMERDINLDIADRWGKTALIHALEAKDAKHEKAVVLLQKGANPHTGQHDHLTMVKCSPLICCALQKNFERGAPDRLEFAKFFIASSFITDFDAKYRPGSDILKDELDPDSRSLLYDLYSQPWPLVKLAFVAVSSFLGPNAGREDRVKKSGLPQKIQNLLLYQDPISRLPRHHWDSIQCCFDPARYERLPKPRPLLHYWPVGREVVKCYCKKCVGKGLNFHGV